MCSVYEDKVFSYYSGNHMNSMYSFFVNHPVLFVCAAEESWAFLMSLVSISLFALAERSALSLLLRGTVPLALILCLKASIKSTYRDNSS